MTPVAAHTVLDTPRTLCGLAAISAGTSAVSSHWLTEGVQARCLTRGSRSGLSSGFCRLPHSWCQMSGPSASNQGSNDSCLSCLLPGDFMTHIPDDPCWHGLSMSPCYRRNIKSTTSKRPPSRQGFRGYNRYKSALCWAKLHEGSVNGCSEIAKTHSQCILPCSWIYVQTSCFYSLFKKQQWTHEWLRVVAWLKEFQI